MAHQQKAIVLPMQMQTVAVEDAHSATTVVHHTKSSSTSASATTSSTTAFATTESNSIIPITFQKPLPNGKTTTLPSSTTTTTATPHPQHQQQHQYQQQPVVEMGRRRLPVLPSSAVPYCSASTSTLYTSFSSGGSVPFTCSVSQASSLYGIRSISYAAYAFPPSIDDTFASSVSRQLPQQPAPPATSSLASLLGQSRPSPYFSSTSSSSAITTTHQQQQQPPPIIYYTSCAPEKRDVAVNGGSVFGQEEDGQFETTDSRIVFDPTLIASSQSVALSQKTPYHQWNADARLGPAAITTTTMCTSLRPYGSAGYGGVGTIGGGVGPAVIPGATFRAVTTSTSSKTGHRSPRPLSAILPSTTYYLPANLSSTSSTSLSPPRRTATTTSATTVHHPPRSQTMPASERATKETLCQLMLKKELRETLAKRREALDTCEIEASHRQWVIDKWLRTGILPTKFLHPVELDSIPAVVKCTLPAELVAGARVIPPWPHLTETTVPASRPYGSTDRETGQPKHVVAITTMTSRGVGTTEEKRQEWQQQQPDDEGKQQQQQHFRSVGCQATPDWAILPPAAAAFAQQQPATALQQSIIGSGWPTPATAYMPSTSLSAQIRSQSAFHSSHSRMPTATPIAKDASTQTALCAETQTDSRGFDAEHVDWSHHLDNTSMDVPPAALGYYNLLERQQQQQQQQPNRQTQHGALAEQRQQRRRRQRLGRFLATSDTISERGKKEHLVQEELERRRRELRYSLGNLRDDEQQQQQQKHIYSTQQQQQYQPTRSHWSNSLPRGFEFTQPAPFHSEAFTSSPAEQQQQQQQLRRLDAYDYGSLPRDYERRMAAEASAAAATGTAVYTPIREQFAYDDPTITPSAPSAYGRFNSRSMQELDQLERYEQQQQRWYGGGGPAPRTSGWPIATTTTRQREFAAYPSHSLNYLDRIGVGGPMDEMMQDNYHHYPHHRRGAAAAAAYRPTSRWAQSGMAATTVDGGTLGLPKVGADHLQGIQQPQQQQQQPDGLLLSEYANYLNNQFLLDQRQRELADREQQLVFAAAEQTKGAPMGYRQPYHFGGDNRVVGPTTIQQPYQQQQLPSSNPYSSSPSAAPSYFPGGPLRTSMSYPTGGGGYPLSAECAIGLNNQQQFSGIEQPGVYSRNETNYGARPPPQMATDYGNLYWRNTSRQPPQADYSQSYTNLPYGQMPPAAPVGTTLQQNWPQAAGGQPAASFGIYCPPPPAAAAAAAPLYHQQQQQRPQQPLPAQPLLPTYTGGSQQYFPSAAATTTTPFVVPTRSQQQQQLPQSQRVPPAPPQSILRRRAPPLHGTTTTTATGDEIWPREMSWPTRSSGQRVGVVEEGGGERTTAMGMGSGTRTGINVQHSVGSDKRTGEIKRLLLARRYKFENIFKDLGIRVVGGKKLSNRDLGAFITSVDKSRAQETLGELSEGDQVLEWNGVLLNGKTYEEVERIIQASTGEIELIVDCRRRTRNRRSSSRRERNNNQRGENCYNGNCGENDNVDDDNDGNEINGNGSDDDDGRENVWQQQGNGVGWRQMSGGMRNDLSYLERKLVGPKVGGGVGGIDGQQQQKRVSSNQQHHHHRIAFAADTTYDDGKWHSPNEPPPVPAHQNNNGNGQRKDSDVVVNKRQKADDGSTQQQLVEENGYAPSAQRIGGQQQQRHYHHPTTTMEMGGGGRRPNGTTNSGYLQLALFYEQLEQTLRVRVIAARGLASRGNGTPPNAFVKIYLLPGRNVSNKRRTKYVPQNMNPVWDQQVEYYAIGGPEQLSRHFLEFTVFDYDRDRRSDVQPLGQCLVNLADPSIVFSGGTARWFALQPPTHIGGLIGPSYSGSSSGQNEPYGDMVMLPNETIARSGQQRAIGRIGNYYYNPATLDMLDGYPAI